MPHDATLERILITIAANAVRGFYNIYLHLYPYPNLYPNPYPNPYPSSYPNPYLNPHSNPYTNPYPNPRCIYCTQLVPLKNTAVDITI